MAQEVDLQALLPVVPRLSMEDAQILDGQVHEEEKTVGDEP
jgi:hypothetical protein